MLVEAIPRLVINLRSIFPDAMVEVASGQSLRLSFPHHQTWQVEVKAHALPEPQHHFHLIESSLLLKHASLSKIQERDLLQLVASENMGLRGVSVIPFSSGAERGIRVRTSFIGLKGRTRDEAENITIDILSLLRFGRLLEDRLQRSSCAEHFCIEMYHSQYVSKDRNRNRFINYARSIFQGSTERAFGQMIKMLKEDYRYKIQIEGPGTARVSTHNNDKTMILRIPEEIPMVTCSSPIGRSQEGLDGFEETARQVAKLNESRSFGHYEVSPEGSTISFVTWKHLTNDIRYYSLDFLIDAVTQATRELESALALDTTVSPITLATAA